MLLQVSVHAHQILVSTVLVSTQSLATCVTVHLAILEPSARIHVRIYCSFLCLPSFS